MSPRNAWNNSRHWPVCYRTQREAELPSGPIDDGDDHSKDWQDWLAIGVAIGLLCGLALIDLIESTGGLI